MRETCAKKSRPPITLVIGGHICSNVEPRPLVPRRLNFFLLSVASLSVALQLRCCQSCCSPLRRCFERKAGPPSSLPFSALVLHPAVIALSRRGFLNPTVELLEPSADFAMVVPAGLSWPYFERRALYVFLVSASGLRKHF